ncbi:MAG: tRNA (adenosine(37)-N6)-threonylcarbamoyltransferase complex dimerization subunit type 1 TsaB [Acutalibacteraceae bacterium]
MKILAVDTSAVCASVAVTEDDKIISLCQTNAGLTHSRTLLPMIDAALQNSETDLDSIDFFAVSQGPGSFTGIRIGIAAIKGLCDAKGKQCLPVSTLEGLSLNLLGQDVIACCVMDARCRQVYTALFDIEGEKITRLCEDKAVSIEELGKELSQYNKKVVFVGDGAQICHDSLGYDMAPPVLQYQNAASVAFAAKRKYDRDGICLPAGEVMPVYLRLPQAERELKAKKESKESI